MLSWWGVSGVTKEDTQWDQAAWKDEPAIFSSRGGLIATQDVFGWLKGLKWMVFGKLFPGAKY